MAIESINPATNKLLRSFEPLTNEAARQKARSWDASILSLPEEVAKPHAPQYFMRGPGPNMRVTKVTDPVTQTLLAYTIEGVFGRDDRVIWMDGRPHPSEYAEHTWDGFSTGKIVGNQLVITTTHMKYGVIQRNGVPASPSTCSRMAWRGPRTPRCCAGAGTTPSRWAMCCSRCARRRPRWS